MMFTVFAMTAVRNNHSQILLSIIQHRDTYGSGDLSPYEFLFDVEHWNSFYPALPRMVSFDPIIFDQFDCKNNKWRESGPEVSVLARKSLA